MSKSQLREDLERDEGWRPHVYKDTEGYWTIGYGFLVDPQRGGGMPQFIGDIWLDHLIREKATLLRARWPEFDDQHEDVQRALANMAYQLGVNGLLNFKKMIAALERGDRLEAAAEALDSTWAKQTPARARRMAALISGDSQPED